MNKPPPQSLYAKLTEDQRAQLYDWILTLGYVKTKDRIALAKPEGFGISTHLSCLHRFFKRYQQKLRTEDIVAAKENRSSPEDTSILVFDAEQSVQHAAQHLASSPMDSDQFRDVSRWLATHKDHELKRDYYQLAAQQLALARERLAFDRERYEFDTARTVLLHHMELVEIRKNDTLTDEEKIDQARSLIFNRPISELPPRIVPKST
jgi:hypothetical protein